MKSEFTDKFTGPLFLIGMPRSGTKLLRSLLNEHSEIGIPNVETEFLPYWVRNWSRYGDLSDPSNFKRFYQTMLRLPYFTFMRESATAIKEEVWFELCRSYTPAGVFEALVRHDAKVDIGTKRTWGDKSPSYIEHLPLLREIFPNARFVHIIRDVRDYCPSINKAWGKNMLRAAQRWTDSLHKVRADTKRFSEDYYEVRYESLLEEPEAVLRDMCAFLDLKFDSKMLRLSQPCENFGDAKGRKEVVRDNKDKYLRTMKPSLRKKIEAISEPMLRSCGYHLDDTYRQFKVSNAKMLCYQTIDGLNLIRSEMKTRGLIGAVRFHLRYYLTSGNRKESLVKKLKDKTDRPS